MSASNHSQPATQFRWLIVAMLMGFTILGHFNRISISVAGTERFIGPDRLTKEQMGLVYSAFLLVYTLGMLPGGWIIDRLGPRLALAGMGVGMGLCVILTGGLGWTGLPIASLWLPLLVIRAIAGGSCVPLHPAAARSVASWISLPNRTLANGLVTAGALIGISLSSPIFGKLMDLVDWPMAFVICGSIMVVFAFVWLFTTSDCPADSKTPSENVESLNQSAEASADRGDHVLGRACHTTTEVLIDRPPGRFGELARLCLNHNLLFLALSYGALSYLQYLFFYWLDYYFEDEMHWSVTESRNSKFVVMMSMALGMALGGLWTDHLCQRLGRRWGSRSIAIFGMGLSALFAWAGANSQASSHVICLFSLSFGSLGLCEGIFWTTAPLLEKQNGGLACAFVNTLGNGAGLLAPIATPLISDRYGWSVAVTAGCVVCGIGAIPWIWIDADVPDANQGV